MTGRAALGLGLAALLLGCADETRNPVFVSLDSAGVETVTFGHAAIAGLTPLGGRVALRIGAVDGPPELTFAGPLPRLRSDGGIVIADAFAREIRLFDGEGAHRRTFGREGEGPGEFVRLYSVFVTAGDSIVAYDNSNRRVSVFGPEGEFARSHVLAAPPGSEAGFPSLEGVFPSGEHLVRLIVPASSRGEPGVSRGSFELHRYGPAGAHRALIGRFPAEETLFARVDGSPLLVGMPLGRETHVAVRGDGLIISTGEDWSVAYHDLDSSRSRVVRRTSPPLATTDAHITAVRARYEDASNAVGAMILRALEDVEWPTTLPPISDLGATPEGAVWVAGAEIPAATERTWIRLDEAGLPSGIVRLPASFRPAVFGIGSLLGVNRDALDVPVVELWQIEAAS